MVEINTRTTTSFEEPALLDLGEGNFLDLIRASQHTKAINLITSKQRAAMGMYF